MKNTYFSFIMRRQSEKKNCENLVKEKEVGRFLQTLGSRLKTVFLVRTVLHGQQSQR